MSPITFACRRETNVSLGTVLESILDVKNWTTFKGWGPLPGIRSAEIESHGTDVVGTAFRVLATNGDTHRETITRWEPERLLEIRMDGFTRPLGRMATHFVERWSVEGEVAGRHVMVRSFELHACSRMTRPMLFLIRFMMRRAIDRHSAAVLGG